MLKFVIQSLFVLFIFNVIKRCSKEVRNKMDKIYIRDLEFIGYHGVFEEEKKLGQKFYLSLELSTD